MARFIYIAVLIAVASLSYSEAVFIMYPHQPQRECTGGRYDIYGPITTFEPTCDYPNMGKFIQRFPKEGCQCKSGTVRHYSGHCIAYEDCEKHNNEVSDKSNIDKPFVRRTRCNGGPFDEYGRIISREPTCGDSTTVVIFLQNIEGEGCRCIDGTVRHNNGDCVPRYKCGKYGNEDNDDPNVDNPSVRRRQCEPYEKFGRITTLEPTCERPLMFLIQSTDDETEGCHCVKGTLRRKDGSCVPPSECDLNGSYHYSVRSFYTLHSKPRLA